MSDRALRADEKRRKPLGDIRDPLTDYPKKAVSALSLAVLDTDLMRERMRPGGLRVGWHFLPTPCCNTP